MSFVRRRLEAAISLAVGEFVSGKNTVTISGLRMSARIAKAGGLSDSTLELTIWGMTASLMRQLSTLGMQINLVPKNGIVLTAGDEGSTLGTVFVGYITSAYADFQSAPEVSFRISAHVGLPDAVIPVPVSSFKGPADCAGIMAGFATLMGLKFENNGVNQKLSNPYYSGSAMDQAQACVTEANISWNRGDDGILAIWPKYGSRGGTVPLISPTNGMIGYPTYTAYGIMVKTLFNPSIGFGAQIEVQTAVEALKAANGKWAVYSLDHDLDCEMPNGSWSTMIGGYNPTHPNPVLAR